MTRLTFTDAIYLCEVLDRDVSSIVDEYITGYKPETPTIDFRWLKRYLESKDTSRQLSEIQEEMQEGKRNPLPKICQTRTDVEKIKFSILLNFLNEKITLFGESRDSWKETCLIFDCLCYAGLNNVFISNKKFRNAIIGRICHIEEMSKTYGFWYGKKKFWMKYFKDQIRI